MSSIIWKWNETDVSQFGATEFYPYGGSPTPASSSLGLSAVAYAPLGRNVLRLSGGVGAGYAAIPLIDGGSHVVLPEKYTIQFTLLSWSISSGIVGISPFFNSSSKNGLIMNFDRFGYIYQSSSTIGSTVNIGFDQPTEDGFYKGGIKYSILVNQRPNNNNISGSFSLNVVKFAPNSLVANALTQTKYNSLEYLSSSWGSNIGGTWHPYLLLGNTFYTSCDVLIADLQILKHPLEQDYLEFL